MRGVGIGRIRIITVAVLLLALVGLGRLYDLQVQSHHFYAQKAQAQYVHTVEDMFDRGSIFYTTKDGERLSAAAVKTGSLLAVDPSRVTDPNALFEQLSPHISIEKDTFLRRARLPDRRYVVIDETVPEAAAREITARDLPGVMLYRNQWRYYPGEDLAARTIGFVGHTEESGARKVGLYGLERWYEPILRRNEEGAAVNFFAEIFSDIGQMVQRTQAYRDDAGHVVTHLEPTVARELQTQLYATHDTWQSELTGGIIMRPDTGAIVALDAVPSFNPNNRTDASIEDFKNPLVESVYEFGSIYKALTMAAGLDAGVITAATRYTDMGSLTLNGETIRNYDGRARGEVPMQVVLNDSLNTGAAHIVTKLGKARFRSYFYNLELDSETGIDLPNEAYGLLENLRSPREIEYATASFGQGVATTPIAMARALATLANGGVLITPHIARQIAYERGDTKTITYPKGDRVFQEETSDTISRMLTKVVDEALAGGEVALERYQVAAKTGTAQIPDLENGGYYDDQYLHSFFGYFPSDDPEFLVFLYTVKPQGARYASETLTDPFMSLARFLINYYNLPPDR